MKIIHVSTISTGTWSLLSEQGKFFKERGYEVGFVVSDHKMHHMFIQNGFFVKEIRIARKIHLIKDLQSIVALYRYFKQERPDIVHTHASKSGVIGRIAAKLAKVPKIIHTVHGFPFYEGLARRKYYFYLLIEKMIAKITDAILSQSQEDILIARKYRLRSKSGDLVHIGNGINLQQFDPARIQREYVREELGIDANAVVITMVARFNPVKGHRDLVKALKNLEGNWKAVLIGHDEGTKKEVEDFIKQYGLKEKVILLDRRMDIPNVLKESDIYVLPSYTEGVPRSVIEAQAMGLPAVVTDIRGNREIVVNNQTGFIVPVHCSAALQKALQRLVNDEKLRKSMGSNGRKRIVEHFDEQQVMNKILHEYEKQHTS